MRDGRVLHGVCWARGASVAIITDGENTFVRSRIWNLCEPCGNKRLYTFLIHILDYVKCKCIFVERYRYSLKYYSLRYSRYLIFICLLSTFRS